MKFLGQNRGGNSDKLSAVIQIHICRNLLDEFVALGRYRARSGVKSKTLEGLNNALEQTKLVSSEQGK